MSWALSCLQVKRYHTAPVLYTDVNGAGILIDELQLPYSEVNCELDVLNKYDPGLWALAKIYAYSLQKDPFISIDGDAFLWKPMDAELLKEALVAQNIETDINYYQAAIENIRTNLSFIPAEIKNEIDTRQEIKAYNAGIIGGNDIDFFAAYTKKAFEFVDRNIAGLHKINISAFNTVYEQYLFYCMAKKQHKKVGVFIQDIISDLRYKGFADFSEVPYNKKYLHLHGSYKKKPLVCRQMANRLRNDYPEYYYRIIALFKKNGLPLTNDAYGTVASATEKALVRRFYLLKQNTNLTGENLPVETRPFSFWRSAMCKKVMESCPADSYPPSVITKLFTEVSRLEKKIAALLKKQFSGISKTVLYQVDILNAGYIESVFGDKNIDEKELMVTGYYELIQTPFDWSFFENSSMPPDNRVKEVLNSFEETSAAIIVPECYGEGYSLYNADELYLRMLEELQRPLSIGSLRKKMAVEFDMEENHPDMAGLELLLFNRIKQAIVHKVIKWVS